MDADVAGGTYQVGVTASSDAWTVSSSSDWITDIVKTATGITFNVEQYAGYSSRTATVTVGYEGKEYVIIVTQAQDAALFKGAVSEKARELAYKVSFITEVTDDSYTRIDENVSMLTMRFKGQDAGTSYPMAMFLYEIDLTGDVSLAVTCADDSDASIKATAEEKTATQLIRTQLAKMQANRPSVSVLGGVNGDFYLMDENNLLQGVCYRNGVCLKDSFYETGNTVFAIRNDGTAIILDKTAYGSLKSSIKEAVGGRKRLLSNGSVNGDNNSEYDPRTSVGVSQDRKKVYLLVMDGRDGSWSYGATYYDVAKILLAAGAYNAINLDGGGSTTFVQRTAGTEGTSSSDYKTLNHPRDTDGSTAERAVVNGLAIVKN